MVYEPKSGLVAVMNGNDGTVNLIDPVARKAAGSLTVGGKLEFAAADGSGKVFVNVEDKNELVEIDMVNRKVGTHIALTGCEEPTGLDYDAQSHVLLAACSNGKAAAVFAATGKLIGLVAIGEHPDAVIVDVKNRRFLVPCGGNGVLSEVKIASDGSLSAGAQFETKKGARTGALDPATGKVYLPVADYEAAKPGERPAMVPGSFHLLVLGQN